MNEQSRLLDAVELSLPAIRRFIPASYASLYHLIILRFQRRLNVTSMVIEMKG